MKKCLICGKKAEYLVKIPSSDNYKYSNCYRCSECKVRAENSYDNINCEKINNKKDSTKNLN